MNTVHEEENAETPETEDIESSRDAGKPGEGVEAEGSESSDEKVEDTPISEAEKWKDVAARSQAELDNFRKRMAREKAEAIQYANRQLLEQLLPILDNFEMGLKAAQDSEGESSMILQGMAMVRKQMEDFLTDQGVEVLEPNGLAFDPNLHEALKQEPHDSVPEGCVIFTMRRGYRLGERVLRAAYVVVSSGPGEEKSV